MEDTDTVDALSSSLLGMSSSNNTQTIIKILQAEVFF